MRIFRNKRGAVSIFLIIILVPMLILSSIFVDLSRIELANAVAAATGDLTLNTALTDYDELLKDMYGLFGTSQDIDSLLENLEDYYRESIEAAGIAPADAEDYTGQIMSMFRSETGTDDLLNINVTKFSVEKPTGANLANPAILKEQMIEFMKYRAPINAGMGLIEGLSGMKNMKKQTKNIENKNNFYDKQKTVLENLEAAWKYIQTYQYQYAEGLSGFPTGTYLNEKSTAMNGNIEGLNTCISDTVKYLYFADNVYMNGYSIEWDDKGTTEGDAARNDDVWKFNGEVIGGKYSDSNRASNDKIFEELNKVMADINALENCQKSGVYKLISETGNTADPVRKIYVVRKFNEEGMNEGGYAKTVKNLLTDFVHLQKALQFPSENPEDYHVTRRNNITYETSSSGDTLKKCAQDQINNHLNRTDGGYFFTFNTYAGVINQYCTDVSGEIDAKKSNVNTQLQSIRNMAVDYYFRINSSISLLNRAVTKLNDVKISLSEGGDYKKALEDWKGTANGLKDDSMGKQDLAEIETVKDVVTVSNVNALITKLNSAKGSLEDIRGKIEGYKFEGTSWKDFPDGMTYKNLIDYFTSGERSQIEGVPVDNNNSYNAIIGQIQGKAASGGLPNEHSFSAQGNPNLVKEQTKLYTWMYSNYFNSSLDYNVIRNGGEGENKDNSINKKKDEKSETQKKSEDKKTDTDKKATSDGITKYTDRSTVGSLPSKNWSEVKKSIVSPDGETEGKESIVPPDGGPDVKNASAGLEGIFQDGFFDALKNMATSLRDNLYMSNYILEMFSYDTFEKEIEREITNKKTGLETTVGNWYTQSDNSFTLNKTEYADNKKAKSLTLIPISPNKNYLYGSEVEYILYGKDTAKENIDAAYGTIYLLRFVLNTIYAFTDSEINGIATAAATAMFGTPPLTPLIPIARFAIIVAFGLAESAWDVYLLKTGAQVPLVKSSDTFVMKPSGVGQEIGEAIADAAVDKGLEVVNDCLEMTNEQLQKYIGEGGDKLADLGKSLTGNVTDKAKNYANEALQEVMNLCNAQNLKEMENNTAAAEGTGGVSSVGQTVEKVNNVKASLQEWLTQQKDGSGGDIAYEAKEAAVSYLMNDGVIGDIFDKIKATGDNASNALEGKLNEIREKIDGKIDDLAKSASSKLGGAVQGATDKLKEAAANGAESLRTEIKNQIDGAFGDSSIKENASQSVFSSLLSWSYKDYLSAFLLIGFFTSEEKILLRTADVIQMNMQYVRGDITDGSAKADAFQLDKAHTYLTVNATMEVKPLMMTMPLAADTVKSQLDGTNWYTVRYSGTLGY